MRYVIYLLMPLLLALTSLNTQAAQDVLTLDEVIVSVLEKNPELRINDFEALSAAARIRLARQTPPMSVNLELENFAGSGTRKGSDTLETTLSLSKVFELGDKAGLRGDVAQRKFELLSNNQDAKRLDILSEAVRRFIHVIIDQHRLVIANDKLTLAKRTYNVVNKRVKAGRSPVAERRRISIALARAEIELEHAEHELATTRVKLTSMWGKTKPEFTTAQGGLFELEAVAPFSQLETLLELNPDLVRFATAKRLTEARLNLAIAKQSANVAFTAGVRNFSATDDNAFVFSANIPFGLNSRAAADIEAENLQLQKEPFNYEKQKLALYVSLYEVYQELQHAYKAVEVLSERILPEAKQALREYEKGYAAGRYSFLELTDAQRTLLDARLEVIVMSANYHRYRIEIDRLTGARLSSVSSATGVTK